MGHTESLEGKERCRDQGGTSAEPTKEAPRERACTASIPDFQASPSDEKPGARVYSIAVVTPGQLGSLTLDRESTHLSDPPWAFSAERQPSLHLHPRRLRP